MWSMSFDDVNINFSVIQTILVSDQPLAALSGGASRTRAGAYRTHTLVKKMSARLHTYPHLVFAPISLILKKKILKILGIFF